MVATRRVGKSGRGWPGRQTGPRLRVIVIANVPGCVYVCEPVTSYVPAFAVGPAEGTIWPVENDPSPQSIPAEYPAIPLAAGPANVPSRPLKAWPVWRFSVTPAGAGAGWPVT